MPSEAIVHVVDDDIAVRQSLAFLITTDGLAVRVHESASAFLDDVKDATTGCIVTDVRMPGLDGIAFLRQLKTRGFCLPVIVMTGHADVPLAVEAMKEGAIDFIEKPFDDERFLRSVRTALDRNEKAARQFQEIAAVRARLDSLSERESQVLAGLVAGKANKVIAHELGISPRTVEIYRSHVMTKMQVRSLPELVKLALAGAPAD